MNLDEIVGDIADLRIEHDPPEEAQSIGSIFTNYEMVKQRLDSRDQYISAGRKDLADNESKEILVLESFLPSEASPEEITKAIYEVISEKGWGDGETGPQIPKKCMGEAIKLVKAKLTNVDGKLLADTVKTYLV